MRSVFSNLPEDLRKIPQWAVAGEDGSPKRIKANGKLERVSLHDIHLLHCFEEVEAYALENEYVYKSGMPTMIGFILSENDPFACVDLDIKDGNSDPENPEKWTSSLQCASYEHIVHSLGGYTELSRSRIGYHTWVRANIGAGVRRSGVEIYSQERFIICTGNVYLEKPIVEANQFFSLLVEEMKQYGGNSRGFDLAAFDKPEVLSDEAVMEMAQSANNSEKFKELYEGGWCGLPSQSEADMALMSMFTFYSPNNAQVKRLFRTSALGKREKATKNDRHMDYTLRLVRGRESREQDAKDILLEQSISAMTAIRNEALAVTGQKVQASIESVAKLCEQATKVVIDAPVEDVPAGPIQHIEDPVKFSVACITEECTALTTLCPVKGPSEKLIALAQKGIADINVAAPAVLAEQCGDATELTGDLSASVTADGLQWPPGQVGAVAKYIYSVSPRPVQEISIAAALAFFAGILGKAYNIENGGLNLYIILIARSAVGKEAMNSGISKIVKALENNNVEASDFIDFSNYVSAPALLKSLPENPCTLNVNGEFGRKLAIMAEGRDGALAGLRTLMTELYQKSGRDSIVGGSTYSKKEDGSEKVHGVAYSLLGETTPQTFFQCLTPSMMEDGFMSRFTLITYKGERPPRNKVMNRPLPAPLLTFLSSLVSNCKRLIAHGIVTDVAFDDYGRKVLDDFSDRCDGEIKGITDEGVRQMWNRAHLKAQRIAAVLATADNDKLPIIRKVHCDWGIGCVLRDIDQMKTEMKEGNVGDGDDARVTKLVSVIRSYINVRPAPSYKISNDMWKAGVIPRAYLQIKLQKSPAYVKHRMGSANALNSAIKEAILNGYIIEVDKTKLAMEYKKSGVAYRMVELPE